MMQLLGCKKVKIVELLVFDIFENECVRVAAGLFRNNNYYFHGKIKRIEHSNQTFNIKLVKSTVTSNEDNIEQYLKTITVSQGLETNWADVGFIFTPYDIFVIILFELQRDRTDCQIETRYPLIIYEELSLINNIIPII